MNLKTTLADIVLSAQAAANKAHGLGNALQRLEVKLAEFRAGEFDFEDFQTWENAFNGQLEMLDHFSKQPSPAVVVAAKKVAAAPAVPQTA